MSIGVFKKSNKIVIIKATICKLTCRFLRDLFYMWEDEHQLQQVVVDQPSFNQTFTRFYVSFACMRKGQNYDRALFLYHS